MSKVTVMKEVISKQVDQACCEAYNRGRSDQAYSKSADEKLPRILTSAVVGKVMLELDHYEIVKRSHLQQLNARSIEAWDILVNRKIPLDHIEATSEGYVAYGADAKPLDKEYDHTEFAQAVIDVYESYKMTYGDLTKNPNKK